MGKLIDSPVKRWSGGVRLHSYLTFPQVIAFESAIQSGREYLAEQGDDALMSVYSHMVLPGVFGCIEEWQLEGFPEDVDADSFPATPRIASAELLNWLITAITGVMRDDEKIPND